MEPRNDHEGDIIQATATPSEDTCPKCGRVAQIGDWPFCRGQQSDHISQRAEYRPFKSYVEDLIFEKPTEVTSYQQFKRILKANNLEERGRQVGMPGCEV